MHGRYKLTYRVWPYSVEPKDMAAYKAACGDEIQYNHFVASDFQDAYRQAQTFLAGVRTNKCVWQCPMQALEWMRE